MSDNRSDNLPNNICRKKLLLASGSPRRLELLRAAGIEPEVLAADVEELTGNLPPSALVQANAELKARAVAKLRPEATILAADTVVALGGRIFGKPQDEADAKRMLAELSGRTHSVFTGVAVWLDGELKSEVAETKVTFREMNAAEIAAYVAGGEPMDKAGAYAIQGEGGAFVKSYEGDFDNIVGLPMRVVAELLPLAEFAAK
jgi:septum formation protein